MKSVILNELDYDSKVKLVPGRLDVEKGKLYVTIEEQELEIDVSELKNEKLKEWPDGKSPFRLSMETYVTVDDAHMLKEALNDPDHRTPTRAWDFPEYVKVFSDASHHGNEETPEEYFRVRAAAHAIAERLRYLTGKEHKVTDLDHQVTVSFDDMFTEENEKKWFGFLGMDKSFDEICKRYNVIWES